MIYKLDWKQIEMLGYMYAHKDCISVDIAKDLRITYSHVSNFLQLLTKENLIVYEDVEHTRVKHFTLTPPGKELAFRCYNLVGVLESIRVGMNGKI